MYLSSALVAGLLAARASAFLIPPRISEAAFEVKKGLISVLADLPRSVELDCPGCPFAGVETAAWQDNVENRIVTFQTKPRHPRLPLTDCSL